MRVGKKLNRGQSRALGVNLAECSPNESDVNQSISNSLPPGWAKHRLRALIEVIESGLRPKGGASEEDSGVPSFGGENITPTGSVRYSPVRKVPESFFQNMSKGHLKENDVLINKDGANTGKVGIYTNSPYPRACINEHLFLLRGNKEQLSQWFLYYFLLSNWGQKLIKARITGSAQPGLGTGFLDDVTIFLPPISVQKTITEKLQSIDATKSISLKLIAQLTCLKQAMLQQLLMCGLPGRHAKFKQTVVGPIPITWQVKRLQELGEIKSGFTINPDRRPQKEPRPYLRVANVQQGCLDLSEVLMLEATNAEFNARKIDIGDLLIVEGHANIKDLGRCCVANELVSHMTHQNHIHRLIPDKKHVNSCFLQLALSTKAARKLIEPEGGTSSGLHTLSRSSILSIQVPVPSLDEQREIAEVMTAIGSRLDREKALLDQNDRLKQTLLTGLLTGKIPLPKEVRL